MVKWTTEEQFKLLRTALLCEPTFKFNAKAVVAAWPVGANEVPPTERAVNDRYKQIMQHGRDISTWFKINKEETGNESSTNDQGYKVEAGTIATSRAPPTPARRSQGKVRAKAFKKPTGGSEPSGTEMMSERDTSSDDSETAFESPIRRSTRVLRTRKPRTAPTTSEESDMSFEAGAKDYENEDSDDDYELTKKRQDEADWRKEANLAARHD